MIVERLTDNRIGLRCDICHKSLFLNTDDPVRGAEYLGWYVGGDRHEDTHVCGRCKTCARCAHYNGATEAGTGVCRATQERTFMTTRCFNRKFKPK